MSFAGIRTARATAMHLASTVLWLLGNCNRLAAALLLYRACRNRANPPSAFILGSGDAGRVCVASEALILVLQDDVRPPRPELIACDTKAAQFGFALARKCTAYAAVWAPVHQALTQVTCVCTDKNEMKGAQCPLCNIAPARAGLAEGVGDVTKVTWG